MFTKSRRFLSAIIYLAIAVFEFSCRTVVMASQRIVLWFRPAKAQALDSFSAPANEMRAARSFWQNLVQRKRPLVTPMWRMCTSV